MCDAPPSVHKIGHWVMVNVVNGVPLCLCCQEPCVEREGGWMCALGAAALDFLAPSMAALDKAILGGAG